MFYVRLIRRGEGYLPVEANSVSIGILGFFLRDEVGYEVVSYKDWISNPNYDYTAGNTIYLEKKDDNIILGDLYADKEYEEDVLEIPQKQLLDILDKWEELCKQMPKEILITMEGDKITLEGKD